MNITPGINCSVALNTTFVVPSAVKAEFLEWVDRVYLPSAMDSGAFGGYQVMLIQTVVEEGFENIAVQLLGRTQADAERYLEEMGRVLADDVAARWGGRVVFFTTMMDILKSLLNLSLDE